MYEQQGSSSCYLQSCLRSVLSVCIPHMQTPTDGRANYPGSDLGVKCHPVRPHNQDTLHCDSSAFPFIYTDMKYTVEQLDLGVFLLVQRL